MKARKILAVGLVILAAGILPVWAGALGDEAKPLQVAKWVKGEAVDLAAGKDKSVFVVEFWATWCPPCRKSIPHLTELQKKYKDRSVIFVGVSNEDEATVQKFVDEMGDKMDYPVAVDDKDATGSAYMKAFEINSIPHAFIVDKAGKIVWHGHPMDQMEEKLKEILGGK